MSMLTTKIIAVTVTIICLLFTILLCIIYFRKKNVKNKETQLYSILLIINFITLLVEIVFYYTLNFFHEGLLIDIIEKTYYLFTIIWMYIMTIYTFSLTKPFYNTGIYEWSYNKKRMGILSTIGIIIILLATLKIERKYVNGIVTQSVGSAPTSMFLFCFILLIVNFVLLIIKRKSIPKRKALPMYFFFILVLIQMLLSLSGAQLLLISLNITLVSHLMYHTIENPDIKLLEEISIAKEIAEKANAAKSDFLSQMSHEVRTPLNAIVGFSESLKEDKIPESSKDKVNDIIIASNNLLEIVNGILDISKIEANKLEIINKEYNTHHLFNELISLVKIKIENKNLDFYINIDKSLPKILYGDNMRLKQVILNVLTNAIKYTKEGSIHFVVSTIIKDDICRLIISIEDTGIGMKEDDLSKIFAKFERLDVEKEITIEGTGLGLAITKKLVDLMNGKIIVQSKYGKGSKFTISIDQRIISQEESMLKQPPKIESKLIDANGAKILLVDDNELNNKVASVLLKKYNFVIDSCDNAKTCIEKINNNEKYDIIFMDDMMPSMTGKEAVKILKSNPDFKIPVIVLTANAITGNKEAYLASGFDDYLSKPIEKKELERIIKEYIHKSNDISINPLKTTSVNSILESTNEFDLPILATNKITKSNKKILLVDDNELNIKLAEIFLKKYGLNITSVTSGNDCIKEVEKQSYDLILIDYMMPDLDGCKTIEKLRKIANFNTPVVLMTATSEDELKEKLDKYKISGYLSKPLKKDELEKILETLLNK